MENEIYQHADGSRVAREEGKTPKGNEIGGRWVKRDSKGNFIDISQYRFDLITLDGYWKKV